MYSNISLGFMKAGILNPLDVTADEYVLSNLTYCSNIVSLPEVPSVK